MGDIIMMTKAVEGTHVGFLHHITGKQVRWQTYGALDMPTAEEVLHAAGGK